MQVEAERHQEPFVGGSTRMSRGNTENFGELESKFEGLLMEWVTKYEFMLANTFCKDWESTRAKTNKLNFWEHDEKQLQTWKIIDYVAVLDQ